MVGAERGLAHGAGLREQSPRPCRRGPGRGRSRPGRRAAPPGSPRDPANSLSSRSPARSSTSATLTCRPSCDGSGLRNASTRNVLTASACLPRLLRLRQRRLGLGLRRPRLARACWSRVGQLAAAVGPGLHGRHGRQPDHAGQQRHGRRRHRRPVPPRPPPRPPRERLAPGRSPARRPSTARRPRPGPGARRSGPRARGHRLEADRLQRPVDRRVDLPRAAGTRPAARARSIVADVVALERRPAGQQAVERGAQAVDVATAGPSRSRSPAACSGLM